MRYNFFRIVSCVARGYGFGRLNSVSRHAEFSGGHAFLKSDMPYITK